MGALERRLLRRLTEVHVAMQGWRPGVWGSLLAMMIFTGCSERYQPVVTDDRGELCFRQDGNDVLIDVAPPFCVSSSCSRNNDGWCEVEVEVEVDGSRLQITTEMSWERDRTPQDCTSDCSSWVQCRVPDLTPGTYTFATFEPHDELDVPVRTPWCDERGPETTLTMPSSPP